MKNKLLKSLFDIKLFVAIIPFVIKSCLLFLIGKNCEDLRLVFELYDDIYTVDSLINWFILVWCLNLITLQLKLYRLIYNFKWTFIHLCLSISSYLSNCLNFVIIGSWIYLFDIFNKTDLNDIYLIRQVGCLKLIYKPNFETFKKFMEINHESIWNNLSERISQTNIENYYKSSKSSFNEKAFDLKLNSSDNFIGLLQRLEEQIKVISYLERKIENLEEKISHIINERKISYIINDPNLTVAGYDWVKIITCVVIVMSGIVTVLIFRDEIKKLFSIFNFWKAPVDEAVLNNTDNIIKLAQSSKIFDKVLNANTLLIDCNRLLISKIMFNFNDLSLKLNTLNTSDESMIEIRKLIEDNVKVIKNQQLESDNIQNILDSLIENIK